MKIKKILNTFYERHYKTGEEPFKTFKFDKSVLAEMVSHMGHIQPLPLKYY